MSNEGPALSVTQPVSVWNRALGVDFRKFFVNLGKAVVAGKVGKWDSAIKSGIDSLASISLKDPEPGEVAWLLIRRALEQSMTKLVEESRDELQLDTYDPGGLDDESIQALDATELTIDRSFFEKPGQLAVVEPTKDAFRRWLVGAGASEPVAGSIAGRLRRYFVSQLHEEWVEDPGRYAKVELFLVGSPFADATGRERAWLRYYAWLQKQIDEPLLGQSFSLRQTYVPLRAYWNDTDEGEFDPAEKATPDRKVRSRVVELDDDLEDWVDAASSDEAIRLLSGGPGSGKSSAAKMFAARMTDRDDLRVVWIPLHRLRFDRDLEAALNEFCKADGPPVDLLEWEERLLLIFDGLDELALRGRASQENAKNFVSEILQLRNRSNVGKKLNLQVLLSGREVAIDEYAGELRRSRTLFLLGHFPQNHASSFSDPEDLLREDRRGRWWEGFHAATGRGPGSLPEDLQVEKLRDLTSQPLLCVLLAIVWDDRGDLDLTPPWALNNLYEHLLVQVYKREWGPEHVVQKALTKPDYLRVMEEIAVGAWQAGEARHVSRKVIKERCDAARLGDALKVFAETAGDGVTQLLTAFYFRKTGAFDAEGEMTFEFTHKSFAEYLVARRIRAWIDTCAKQAKAHEDNVELGKPTRELLADWARWLGPERMEDNLADLVRGEILRQPKERIGEWHETLELMLREAVHRGSPMENVGLSSFPEMKRQARHAELALAVCCAAAAEGSERLTDLQWNNPNHAAEWIHWLSFGRTDSALLIRRGLLHTDLRTSAFQILYSVEFDRSNRGVVTRTCHSTGLGLGGVNLKSSDLSNVFLGAAYLHNAVLDGANLEDANLEMAHLRRASLTGANLKRADLESATLSLANLESANLEGANLEDANLEGIRYNRNTSFKNTQGVPRHASKALLNRIEAGREEA